MRSYSEEVCPRQTAMPAIGAPSFAPSASCRGVLSAPVSAVSDLYPRPACRLSTKNSKLG